MENSWPECKIPTNTDSFENFTMIDTQKKKERKKKSKNPECKMYEEFNFSYLTL